MTPDDVAAFDAALAAGGVALFPADTVYGLAAAAGSREGVERLYRLKGRAPDRPAAVMFFDLERALAALPELGPRTREALRRVLPGAVTAVVPNPAGRFPLACPTDPARLGVRVPRLDGPLEPLTAAAGPVLQSSANPSGGPDPRRLEDVEPSIREGVDVALDAGPLPGVASTVVDLTAYETTGSHAVLREGAVPSEALSRLI
ncbi:MAG TPA: Sua5/YciO/YrdC/YwlC family protein [Thermoleophilaceae bacterium]